MRRSHRTRYQPMAASLLLVSVLTGCTIATPGQNAVDSPEPSPLDLQTIIFSVGYYLDLDAATRADLGPAPTVALALPMLSGTFIGAPEDVGLTLQVDDYNRVGVDFSGVSSLIMRSISSQAAGGALQIVPSDTRFGRFGTFAFEPSSGISLGRTGFLDEAESQYLWLTYFDRPCQVRGRQPLPDGTHLDYYVDIPDAGLYWLRLAPSAGGGDDIFRVGSVIAPVLGIELPKPKTVTI